MYTVQFLDGKLFKGGEPNDSKWNQIPDKPIKSIIYEFTPTLKYKLYDFEAYNHCVERIQGVNTPFNQITSVIIMGKIKNRVYQILFDMKGICYQLVVPYGAEYSSQKNYVNGEFKGWVNGKPLTGWKQGNIQFGATPKLKKII